MKTPRIFRVAIDPHCPRCGCAKLYLCYADYNSSRWQCENCSHNFAGDKAAGSIEVNERLFKIEELIKEIESLTT